MAATVTVKITPKLQLTREDDLTPGVSGGNVTVSLPASQAGGNTVPGQPISLVASKAWVRKLAFTASTPIDLDLTALTDGQGDEAFSSICLVDLRSLEAPDSGKTLTIGGSGGAAEWYDPIGASGDKITLRPGISLSLANRDTGGWTVAARKVLRLDPGANAQTALLILAGG